jgi:hypothetical protein
MRERKALAVQVEVGPRAIAMIDSAPDVIVRHPFHSEHDDILDHNIIEQTALI